MRRPTPTRRSGVSRARGAPVAQSAKRAPGCPALTTWVRHVEAPSAAAHPASKQNPAVRLASAYRRNDLELVAREHSRVRVATLGNDLAIALDRDALALEAERANQRGN